MSITQRFARQQVEDGKDPSAKWRADLPIPTTEVEDPDDCILDTIDVEPIVFPYPLPLDPANPTG